MLDNRFGRRMSVSGMCQEVVWKVSGVRNEKPKPAAGWSLIGVPRWVVQGKAWRVASGLLWAWSGDRGQGVGRGS